MESRLKSPSFLLMSWGRGASEIDKTQGATKGTHLFCGENRKMDQSSLVSHQSGLYTSSIFWMRKHKLCNARRNRNNEWFVSPQGGDGGNLWKHQHRLLHANKQPAAPFNKHKQGRCCLFAFTISIIYEWGSRSIVQQQLRAASSITICTAAPPLTK